MTLITLLFYKCCEVEDNRDGPGYEKLRPLKPCFNGNCLKQDRCQKIINEDLKRIKSACIKIGGLKRNSITKDTSKNDDIDGTGDGRPHYQVRGQMRGWIGNRDVKYKFGGIEPRQAIEIMSNGDCGE